MLVLTRSRDESVAIVKDGVVIAVVQVARLDPQRIRLGFDCLPNVDVFRSELLGDAKVRAGAAVSISNTRRK